MGRITILAAIAGFSLGCDEGTATRGTGPSGTRQEGGVALGVVPGGIYTPGSGQPGHPDVQRPWSTDGDHLVCELGESLGAQWVRIQAGWQGTTDADYRAIAKQARAAGLKTIVLLNHVDCGDPGYVSDYVDELDRLANDVFTNDATVDAFEILNEPNVGDECDCAQNPGQCRDEYAAQGQSPPPRDRTSPAKTVELLQAVYAWAHDPADPRPEIVIAGAPLDTAIDQPWWTEFFAALEGVPGPRPFDAMGVHPYDPFWLHCAADKCAPCFETWGDAVADSLEAIASRLDGIFPEAAPVSLYATEFGFEASEHGTMGVCTAENVADGMREAIDAFESTGRVAAALWYSYRDHDTTLMGLRQLPSTSAVAGHAPRTAVWEAFADAAAGVGGDRDACWHRGAVLPFSSGDARPVAMNEDWRFGSFKAECKPGQAMVGLSAATSDGRAHAALCGNERAELSGERSLATCEVRSFATGDAPPDLGTTDDWDFGYFKGQCGAGDYVAGVSQTPDGRLDSILCCPGAIEASACTTMPVAEGDPRETDVTGDWDRFYFKAECDGPGGRWVRGVSRDPATGAAHAIRCCG